MSATVAEPPSLGISQRPAEPVKGRDKLLGVETLRGVAAVLVVLYHAERYYFGNPAYWPEKILGGLFGFGHAGVEFFFVLSGFIIFAVHARDLGRPDRLWAFAAKRIVRIYPIYWLCLAATLLLLLAFPSLGTQQTREWDSILGSIVLLGIEPVHAVVFVSWTLFHEVLFYGLFAVGIFHRGLGIALFLAWMVACLFSATAAVEPIYPLRFINILFLAGMACALVLQRSNVPGSGLLAVAGAAIFAATAWDDVFGGHLSRAAQIVGYGSGSALGLVAVVALERAGRLHMPVWAILVGQASYAIYLTHMLTMPFIAKALRAAGLTSLPGFLVFPLLVLSAVVAGVVIHRLVEKPLLSHSRRLLLPSRADDSGRSRGPVAGADAA